MSDLIKISCPSCGGKLKNSDESDRLICENCGNGYIVKQTGNTISLTDLPSKQSASVVGNGNVVVRVNVGTAEEQRAKEKTSADEMGECPICGKYVSRRETFRCKRCTRSFICLVHQDSTLLICSDCVQEARLQAQQSQERQLQEEKASAEENTPIVLGVLSVVFSIAVLLNVLNDAPDAGLLLPFLFIPILIGLGTSFATIQRGKKRNGYLGLGMVLISLMFLLISIIVNGGFGY